MKFTFPDARYFIKSLIISALLGLLAWFLAPQLSIENLGMARGFAYGVLAGALIGSLLAATRVKPASADRIESIFVGNLAFRASSSAVRELFEKYGEVHAVRLMSDRVTRKPRGFGFVEMNHRDAMKAIKALNGEEFQGRELKVNIANERKPRMEMRAANSQ
ncbi:MAG TPA: RNA-binding protein [Gammaproteobacteria bacterium]|nr:RNA-binding protein [Gammaproteobacteria bacterium]